jgi:tRNA threonylcarbamoyladenosine biosynthesis protein TsaB
VLLLAFDTTTEHGSLALARDGAVIEEVALHSAEGFSGVIFSEIQRLLDRRGVRLADIGAYAAAAGPGSFTGVRIGLTTAKGLAEMHGRPVMPVSNLKAIAWQARRDPAWRGERLAAVVDARRGEIACAVYDAELNTLLEPWAGAAAEFAARAAEFAPVVYCGPQQLLAPHIVTPRALAGAVAMVAGPGVDPAVADAEYVRAADIRKN